MAVQGEAGEEREHLPAWEESSQVCQTGLETSRS